MDLKFNEKGLIPCIVQDIKTKEVLMLAYMNEESIKISLKEKRMCYWSRSRQELWRKGETSGHIQHLVSLSYDCDKDTLLAQVEQVGAACHRGTHSCFTESLYGEVEEDILSSLYKIIEERKENPVEGSYTSYLLKEGLDKICKKIGEEATETVIAAKNNSKEELIYEVSDLVFHTMVLLFQQGVQLEDIKMELEKRHKAPRKREYK
ncbi:MAG: bifunctional phosphoribosyl-AMP cyclohydrolase/phosphoribosyl-ATP diphosphatase HisIE [Tissierellia bacterium]|nr:bifunctional phosphoribosyl-AMP cyclohydrolase/phosphoribosyl-ATP diphosphatase HisIE [Tissierellia bacterium]